ncbi:unnamed protein product [Rhizoctonia solani]|uniref:HNH nuclease domain-containing protein n=1 Tax=Rhizoctonia solani TaxID=456999 RepID=A0A8H3HCE8_9AGAM|nr:unnamed protein product [Rhizoctonia solani]
MSASVPLPPLRSLFEGDEVARDAYARLLPLEDQRELVIRILGQMLIQAPSTAGRGYVAGMINRCATEQQIVGLGEWYLNLFIKYFKKLRAPLAPSSCTSLEEIQPDSLVEALTSHAEAKRQALVRDNYRCVLSGVVDSSAVESLPWLRKEVIATKANVNVTRCCHIFSGYLGREGNDYLQRLDNAPNIYTIPYLFGDISENQLHGPRVHDLRNTLTLESGVKTCFDRLQIWLEPTGEAENQYVIARREDYNCRGLPKVVTFSSASPTLALPDPQYLALHAAFGPVIKLTDAAGFIARVLQEAEDTRVLSEDGSSGELLNHLLSGESPTVL